MLHVAYRSRILNWLLHAFFPEIEPLQIYSQICLHGNKIVFSGVCLVHSSVSQCRWCSRGAIAFLWLISQRLHLDGPIQDFRLIDPLYSDYSSDVDVEIVNDYQNGLIAHSWKWLYSIILLSSMQVWPWRFLRCVLCHHAFISPLRYRHETGLCEMDHCLVNTVWYTI